MKLITLIACMCAGVMCYAQVERTVYDTTYTTEKERYLITDTSVLNVLDAVSKISSDKFGISGHSRESTNFKLPAGTVKWSYYIGVDEEKSNAFNNALNGITKKFGTSVLSAGPEAAIAVYGMSYLAGASGDNAVQFEIKGPGGVLGSGTRIRDARQILDTLIGNYTVSLKNRNNLSAIQVTIKVSALVVEKKWGDRPVKKMHIASRQEAISAPVTSDQVRPASSSFFQPEHLWMLGLILLLLLGLLIYGAVKLFSRGKKDLQPMADTSVVAQLEKFHDLKMKGAITEEDYNQHKARLLK